MIPLARLRRWTLLGAPALILSAWASAACVPPAVLLWTGLGILLIPRQKQPNPRKKRPMLHRLFFMGNAGCLLMIGLLRIMGPQDADPPWSFEALPWILGAGLFTAVLWERLAALPLPSPFAWALGAAAAAGWVLLLIG